MPPIPPSSIPGCCRRLGCLTNTLHLRRGAWICVDTSSWDLCMVTHVVNCRSDKVLNFLYTPCHGASSQRGGTTLLSASSQLYLLVKRQKNMLLSHFKLKYMWILRKVPDDCTQGWREINADSDTSSFFVLPGERTSRAGRLAFGYPVSFLLRPGWFKQREGRAGDTSETWWAPKKSQAGQILV